MFKLSHKALIILLALSLIGLNIVGYYILPEKWVTTFFQLVFICIPFITNFSLIHFGYKKNMFQINEIIYPTLFLILIWFTSFTYFKYRYEVSDTLYYVTIFLSVVTAFIFNYLYVKQEKKVINVKNMCIKALFPILQQHETFYSSPNNFILCLELVKKISAFTIKKNNISETYYPVFRSTYQINEYYVVCYLRKEDIKNSNLRYLTVTSYENKLKDFKNILKYLIEHFQKSSEIQNENVNKLLLFFPELKKKNTSSFEVFEIVYLHFIFSNNHLIPELLLFWQTLHLNNIPNCQKETNLNAKKINILYNIIKLYPSLINSLHLNKDQNELKKTLHSFFINYNNFTKNDSLDLKNSNILPLFYKCAFNELNLNLDTFTSELIKILKENK